MITIEQVYKAYLDCRKRKRTTSEALDFEMNLEAKVYRLWKEINSNTYYPSKSKCFVVLKPKLREVFAANFRDRVVHHLIYNAINPCIEEKMRDNVFNCRVGKGVQCGAETLRDEMKRATNGYTTNKYIVRCDLKNFFPSIDKEVLYRKLVLFLYINYNREDIEQIVYLLRIEIYHAPQGDCEKRCDKARWQFVPKEKSLFSCEENKGLAIGNLTSQLFANFMLMDLDNFVATFAEFSGRYVDDFYMVGDKCVLYYIQKVKQFLLGIKVTMHSKKIYIQPCKHGVKFIGHNIKYERIHNGNRTINNALLEARRRKPRLESLNSYLGFMRRYSMYNVRKKIITSINKHFMKQCDIIGDYMYLRKKAV